MKMLRLSVVAIVVVGILCAAGYWGWGWWTYGRFIESTDNAYVQADIAVIASKLSGYVAQVKVQDNQPVQAGTVLIEIDPADTQARLTAARAKLERAKAEAKTAGIDFERQKAVIAQMQAELSGALANQERAQLDFKRFETLKADQFVSIQRFEQARAQALQAQAQVNVSQAQVETTRKQREVLAARQVEAQANIRASLAEIAAIELDLANLTLRAPMDGVVGNRTVRVGQFVRPGQQLLAIVPAQDVYIIANYKETQIGAIKPGHGVQVKVDAYPGLVLQGRVESFAPASGAEFALLPPENATGNFTKIVQRIPVRIVLEGPLPRGIILRPGMSIVSKVDTLSPPKQPTSATPDSPTKPAIVYRGLLP